VIYSSGNPRRRCPTGASAPARTGPGVWPRVDLIAPPLGGNTQGDVVIYPLRSLLRSGRPAAGGSTLVAGHWFSEFGMGKSCPCRSGVQVLTTRDAQQQAT